MDHSTLPAHADPAYDFVVEVLRTGLMLTDLVADLIETVPPGSFPGEDTGEVVIEMVTGSLRPALVAAGPQAVADCTALLGAVRDRTLADLQEASRRAGSRERRGHRGSRPRRR